MSDAGALLREALDRWGRPVAVVCDRWRVAELRQALEGVGFPIAAMVERGMGFRDGGQDVRDFRAAVLGDKVRPSASLLLRAALAEARVTSDASGNAKLSKGAQGGRRLRARDDAAAAAILALRKARGAGTGGARRGPAGATTARRDTMARQGQARLGAARPGAAGHGRGTGKARVGGPRP